MPADGLHTAVTFHRLAGPQPAVRDPKKYTLDDDAALGGQGAVVALS